MSDIYEQILGLRAIRSFQPRRVDGAVMAQVLDAGRWTGSAKNRQDWSVVVVTDPEQIDQLASTGEFTNPMRNAPVTIALVQEPEGYEFDTGRLAQNLMLAAASVGLGSCPITLHDESRAAEVLGLAEGARCRYAIAIGYPAPGAGPRRMGARKPLDEIVHHDYYGS